MFFANLNIVQFPTVHIEHYDAHLATLGYGTLTLVMRCYAVQIEQHFAVVPICAWEYDI